MLPFERGLQLHKQHALAALFVHPQIDLGIASPCARTEALYTHSEGEGPEGRQSALRHMSGLYEHCYLPQARTSARPVLCMVNLPNMQVNGRQQQTTSGSDRRLERTSVRRA